MSELEMKVNALVTLCLSNDGEERAAALEELHELSGGAPAAKKDANGSIAAVLLDIGVPDALSGHRYLEYGIGCAIDNPVLIDTMTKGFYPTVAERYGTTPSRVERAIRHAIEVAWDRCDLDVLENYFGNTVSISKGKPTNSEFIARIANYLR